MWLIGDDAEVIVIDAAHDADAILDAIDGRTVLAIVLTHGHNDHINAAVELGRESGAQVWFPAADRMLWDAEHDTAPDRALQPDATFEVAGTTLRAIPTPGHSPGSTSLYAEELGAIFTGDTLFAGGPGATGRSYSDFDTIIASIRDRLLTLPGETVVHTGHGDDTTIGAEAPHLDEWITRGS
ncbi:MBL fold metallo-hydrolase [Aeromicrobium sp. 9AM]|uniref:MBL fold metallo-hydrolase n=1 Tax=Aeromicrobium sp. 9AM TaxID=2653126 RepID=UPI0012F1DFD9|nr:Zn-dependent hydrolase [Aeromicrobium sp. 9AM]